MADGPVAATEQQNDPERDSKRSNTRTMARLCRRAAWVGWRVGRLAGVVVHVPIFMRIREKSRQSWPILPQPRTAARTGRAGKRAAGAALDPFGFGLYAQTGLASRPISSFFPDDCDLMP